MGARPRRFLVPLILFLLLGVVQPVPAGQDVRSSIHFDREDTVGADKTHSVRVSLGVYMLGDVNNDGMINTIDARMAQQHADGVITLTGEAFVRADVDGDSTVDSDDATAIAEKGIGLPTGIPGFAQAEHEQRRTGLPSTLWLFTATFSALAFLRRSRPLLMFLLAGALSIGVFAGCTESARPRLPYGPFLSITSASMPDGATRTIQVVVQGIFEQGGVASLQGRITYSADGIHIQHITATGGFVLKALDTSRPGELRFSVVKPTKGGVTRQAVLQLSVSATGRPRTVHTLTWAGTEEAPVVVGGNTNVEITDYGTGNGQVTVR